MKVLVFVKANADSEAGKIPSTELMLAMGAYNEELVKAGIMKDGGGLHPSVRATRIQFHDGVPTVVPGPFACDGSNLVSGYWIWNVASMEEAVAWAQKAPFQGGELEIRREFTAEDFGAAYTEEVRDQEDRLREAIEKG
jgi:hypothetical protein